MAIIKFSKEMQILYKELVPNSDKCETVAGEMLRALNRIGYRYNNDGDEIALNYGNETCNAAARYLEYALEKYGKYKVSLIHGVNSIGNFFKGDYSKDVMRLGKIVEEAIVYRNLVNVKNTDDFWDFEEREDFDWDTSWDDSEDY